MIDKKRIRVLTAIIMGFGLLAIFFLICSILAVRRDNWVHFYFYLTISTHIVIYLAAVLIILRLDIKFQEIELLITQHKEGVDDKEEEEQK